MYYLSEIKPKEKRNNPNSIVLIREYSYLSKTSSISSGRWFNVVDFSEDNMGLRFETVRNIDVKKIEAVRNPFTDRLEKARVMIDKSSRFYRNRSNKNTNIYWVRFDKEPRYVHE